MKDNFTVETCLKRLVQ